MASKGSGDLLSLLEAARLGVKQARREGRLPRGRYPAPYCINRMGIPGVTSSFNPELERERMHRADDQRREGLLTVVYRGMGLERRG